MKVLWSEYKLDLGHDEYVWYASNGDLTQIHQSEKPPIIFLNGLSCTEQHYEKLIPVLHRNNFPLIINDYRGHFRSSEMPTKRISIESISNDIVSIIKKHKLNDCILIGHSMGANIAVQVALKASKNIQKNIFIAGPASEVSDSMFHSNALEFILPITEKLEAFTPFAQKLLWNKVESKTVSKIVYLLGFNTDQVQEEYVTRYLHDLSKVKPKVFNKLIDELIHNNYLPKLSMLDQPSLIIGGSDDHIVTPKQYQLYTAAMKNAEFFGVEKGSHVPQIEFAKEVNNKILEFINSEPDKTH